LGSRLVVPHTVARGEDGAWLIEIVVGGRPERFAIRPVSVTVSSASSEVWSFRDGLGNITASPSTMPDKIGIEIDDLQTEWGEIAARGDSIEWAPVRLWWWYPGQTLEEAVAVLEGVATDIEFADPDSATRLVFTADQGSRAGPKQWPEAAAVVDETTWLNETDGALDATLIDENILGQHYPTVIGYPGSGDESATQISPTAGAPPGAPALVVQWGATFGAWRLLVCEGRVAATKCTCWDTAPDGLTTIIHEDLTLSETTDLLGRVVTVATMPSTSDLTPTGQSVWIQTNTGAREWWTGWNNDPAFGGGLLFENKLLRGLGDVLVWALSRAGVRVDIANQRTQAAVLNRFKIDTYINTPTEMERWIESNLVPLFPIWRMRSAAGIWYRYINWRATADDAVARIDGRDGQARATAPIRLMPGPIYNRFTLQYKQSPVTSSYRAIAVLAAEHEQSVAFDGIDDRVLGSPVCRESVSRYGQLEKPIVKTHLTWSDTTASEILGHWAARDALPLYGTTYEAASLDRLISGDVVVVDDPDRHLDERIAIVAKVDVGGPTHAVDLILLPQAVRATA
jgi:hypothetical protein